MITAYGTVNNVVDAIHAGAQNFVQKPWDNEKLLADIRSAIARHKAEAEVIQLKRTLKQRYVYTPEMVVDGRAVSLPETLAYKGMMLSGVPNFAWTIGYTNASWTLKVDLVAEFTCRLLAYMAEHGYRRVVPRHDPTVGEVPTKLS